MRKITVAGAGYVGLVTGACLAELGHHVTCLDIDQEKITSLKKGKVPFFEPGLEELVNQHQKHSRLFFTTSSREALTDCELCFLALPTPSHEDESCDTQLLMQAIESFAHLMNHPILFVIKSTVPVGTGQQVEERISAILAQRGLDIPFDVASNPEFLREGSAVKDCLQPDRILIGVEKPSSENLLKELYAPYTNQILTMDRASAELSKYAANTMLALRISLINELAHLCEKCGANIESVRTAMGADKRIGASYLNAGIGFGGSCLPKDVRALRSIAKKMGHTSTLLESILSINHRQKETFFNKIAATYESLEGKTLALWGLSFKPNTDDLREAPSLYLIDKLLKAGATLRLFDPVAMPKAQKLLPSRNIIFCDTEYESAQGADGVILVTEWEQFKRVDLEKVAALLNQKILFDGRNHFEPHLLQEHGFTYFAVGKPPLYSEAILV